MGLEERRYSNLGYASSDTQNGVFCMGTLLEAIGIILETYFRFAFPNESLVGDSLSCDYLWFHLSNMCLWLPTHIFGFVPRKTGIPNPKLTFP
jgi:hypothetical protein